MDYKFINTSSEEHLKLRIQSERLIKEYNSLDYEDNAGKETSLKIYLVLLGKMFLFEQISIAIRGKIFL